MSETFHYRVIYVYDDGQQAATVSFENLDYARKLWTRANASGDLARCWIERRPIGEWEVCSSETGREFMALAPGSREPQAPKEPTDG